MLGALEAGWKHCDTASATLALRRRAFGPFFRRERGRGFSGGDPVLGALEAGWKHCDTASATLALRRRAFGPILRREGRTSWFFGGRVRHAGRAGSRLEALRYGKPEACATAAGREKEFPHEPKEAGTDG